MVGLLYDMHRQKMRCRLGLQIQSRLPLFFVVATQPEGNDLNIEPVVGFAIFAQLCLPEDIDKLFQTQVPEGGRKQDGCLIDLEGIHALAYIELSTELADEQGEGFEQAFFILSGKTGEGLTSRMESLTQTQGCLKLGEFYLAEGTTFAFKDGVHQ